MTPKFIYMKFLGLLTVIVGFSYCLTSFYNFFDAILGNGIIDANANIFIMCLGLLFPLFVFIYGVFFYFYADIYKERKSKLVTLAILIMFLMGLFKLIFSWSFLTKHLMPIACLMGFVHISLAYASFILVIMYIYGKIKYRY